MEGGTTVQPTAPAEGTPHVGIDSLKKGEESKKGKKGGKRPGSGRKKSKERLEVLGIKQMVDAHGLERVDVVVTDKGTGKTQVVKKSRIEALLDVLHRMGLNDKNVEAAKEYLNRTMGRPIQGVQHSGEIQTHEQHLPTKAEIAAAKAYEAALEDDEEDD